MDTITAREAGERFGSFIERAIRGRVTVVTKHGAPKGVLVPFELFEKMAPAEVLEWRLRPAADESP